MPQIKICHELYLLSAKSSFPKFKERQKKNQLWYHIKWFSADLNIFSWLELPWLTWISVADLNFFCWLATFLLLWSFFVAIDFIHFDWFYLFFYEKPSVFQLSWASLADMNLNSYKISLISWLTWTSL